MVAGDAAPRETRAPAANAVAGFRFRSCRQVPWSEMPPTAFSEVTAVCALEPGAFDADVSPDWTIGGKPNGGYLIATLGRAAT